MTTKKATGMGNDVYGVLLYPLSTEKNIRLLESENKLAFAVSMKSTRAQIKKAVEELFKVKVSKVNTVVTAREEKRAYVRLAEGYRAIDIATDLGLM